MLEAEPEGGSNATRLGIYNLLEDMASSESIDIFIPSLDATLETHPSTSIELAHSLLAFVSDTIESDDEDPIERLDSEQEEQEESESQNDDKSLLQ
ncbi:hypothetical protein C0991_011794, partial [Blastosporella zonata]